MRKTLFISCFVVAGCGPLSRPMVHRLEDKQQRTVDEVWNNILTPTDRLDRTLLLDIILDRRLHEMGVDRLEFVSEKHVGDGLVRMEVHFERERPENDAFVFTCFDAAGHQVRQERYTREEVQDRIDFLYGPMIVREGKEAKPRGGRKKKLASKAEREARRAEMTAATQPAEKP